MNKFALKVFICVVMLASATTAQSEFIDPRDGKKYRTVEIGSQTWMSENLNYHIKGSNCYDYEQKNCTKYGRLYDRPTALNVCPPGWHLPGFFEWKKLIDYAGGRFEAGTKLKAKIGWNNGGNGTDDLGFSALPGGESFCIGCFRELGIGGGWWDSNELPDGNGCQYVGGVGCEYNTEYSRWYMHSNGKHANFSSVHKGYHLLSVRCVKD